MTPGGQAVLKLRLATNETYLDRNNVRQERTEWHRVTVWGRRAEALGSSCRRATRSSSKAVCRRRATRRTARSATRPRSSRTTSILSGGRGEVAGARDARDGGEAPREGGGRWWRERGERRGAEPFGTTSTAAAGGGGGCRRRRRDDDIPSDRARSGRERCIRCARLALRAEEELRCRGRHEGRHSPQLPRGARQLRVRQQLRHPLHARRLPGRRLLRVPPVLHGHAEAHRHGRPRRPLPQALREEGRRRQSRSSRRPRRPKQPKRSSLSRVQAVAARRRVRPLGCAIVDHAATVAPVHRRAGRARGRDDARPELVRGRRPPARRQPPRARARRCRERPQGVARWPFVRGVASLVESLRLGGEALRFSAEQLEKRSRDRRGGVAETPVAWAGRLGVLAALGSRSSRWRRGRTGAARPRRREGDRGGDTGSCSSWRSPSSSRSRRPRPRG